MSLNKACQKSLQEKSCIRLELQEPSGDSHLGVVLAVQRKFIVIQTVNAMEFDGFYVLQKQFIREYRQSHFEACQDSILKHNRQFNDLAVNHWLIECKKLIDVISKLKERDLWPGIEAIYNKGRDTAYYQGPIQEVQQKSLEIAGYDAAGNWEQSYDIEFSDLMSIDIGSRYCQHFNRYMRETHR